MGTPETKYELTEEQLDAIAERTLRTQKLKEYHEMLRGKGLAVGDEVGTYVLEGESPVGGVDACGLYCATPAPSPRPSMGNLQPGTYQEIHKGHPVPRAPWRKLPPAEAEGVVTRQDELRLFERLVDLGVVQEREASVFAEIEEKREMIRIIQREIAALDEDRQKAQLRTEETKASVDGFLAGKSEAWKREAIAGVHELQSTIVASVRDNRLRWSDTGEPIGDPPKKPRPLGVYGEVPAVAPKRGRAVVAAAAVAHDESA